VRIIKKIICKNRAYHLLYFVVVIFFVVSPSVLHAGDTEIEPSVYRELLNKAHKKLGFSGQELVVEQLVREVILPLVAKEIANKYGIKPTKGVLLYGLPGTGKSYFAGNLKEFIPNSVEQVINGPELQSKEYGETPRKLRELFELAKKAPSMHHIFIFDEFDSMGRKRTSTATNYDEKNDVINTLLTLIDGLKSPTNILVVGITNRKDDLDDALIRPGRFETHIEVPNCNACGRAEILEILLENLQRKKWLIEDIDPKYWANILDGYTPADLKSFVEEATRRALSEDYNSSRAENKLHLTAEMFRKVYDDKIFQKVYDEAKQKQSSVASQSLAPKNLVQSNSIFIKPSHFMPSIYASCEAIAAYNFVLGTTVKIGHLLQLSFANLGIELTGDTLVPDPMYPKETIRVVGIIDFICWRGDPTDPVELRFRLSPSNTATMQQALSSLIGGPDMELEFLIYDYDYENKKYFKHFHTDGVKIKCVVTKGTEITINKEPDRVVQQPLNFQVSVSITGKIEAEEQALHIAFKQNHGFGRRFGITDT
jgi:ATP-dependent 26S proteasome regulatory subunit